ncbi:hypothetical protein [Actinokineospora cianjurensis]|uniref:Uncharacterized protein n=1 Tax=Actinokineospora cianjurensis TaxID=585224 RepID=A0A421B353_9PSEU|nr:hypothetical protein [Actinokineospora cianjurensis]RLK58710.1 hypothetical protein CLV68_3185 [Actinokineospora cianjurensis]
MASTATWAIIVTLGSANVTVLGAWLLKRRSGTSVEVEIERDGSGWERQTIKITTSAEEAPEAAVLRQLRAFTPPVLPADDPGAGTV